MFHSQSGRPRDEVARSFLPKFRPPQAAMVCGIRSEIQVFLLILQSKTYQIQRTTKKND